MAGRWLRGARLGRRPHRVRAQRRAAGRARLVPGAPTGTRVAGASALGARDPGDVPVPRDGRRRAGEPGGPRGDPAGRSRGRHCRARHGRDRRVVPPHARHIRRCARRSGGRPRAHRARQRGDLHRGWDRPAHHWSVAGWSIPAGVPRQGPVVDLHRARTGARHCQPTRGAAGCSTSGRASGSTTSGAACCSPASSSE